MKVKPNPKSPGKVEVELDPQAEPRIGKAFLQAWREVPEAKFKNILATTDFSELSYEGVDYATTLAAEFGASLSLLNAVQPSYSLGGFESVVLARTDSDIVKIETRHLSRVAKKLSVPRVSITPITRYGAAYSQIAEVAREGGFDLIVTATHGYTGLRRAFIGSTAERVVRHAPCPVLTVPAATAHHLTGGRWASRIQRIVVPIDFSETSAQAFPYAAALAAKFRAEINLVHVVEPSSGYGGFDYVPAAAAQEETNRAAEELLSRVQREAFPSKIRTAAVVRSGVPFQEITREATRSEADLIILTTHGRTGLSHALLGSTAERIVRHAACPVLVVRGKESVK